MYQAKVICDSIASGVRLTTMEVTLPRIVLAEFNTHRMFSRNSASSRAIPVEKRIQAVLDNPFVPEAFASNKAGMQAGEDLDAETNAMARNEWFAARNHMVSSARFLAESGVHKQWANRLIEPFSWTTIVVTATEWDNFFNLRISKLAQPDIRRAAELMKEAMDASTPVELGAGDWHLPYVQIDELTAGLDWEYLARLSVARCARVSYLTHDGKRDHGKDLELHDRLLESRHMSPFEHVACVSVDDRLPRYGAAIMGEDVVLTETISFAPVFYGNFREPWLQYRKTIPNEAVAPKEDDDGC